ncbi:hypothetical protein [Croceicoccus sp. Ery5]|uniref:hypothetical protein n=1 Tax=Croceicoccus sp. Ery5 TaxID=1703340 RepID=UPI001E604877|nr:hypothetical protein [Croceicoccus sp. Ery5]
MDSKNPRAGLGAGAGISSGRDAFSITSIQQKIPVIVDRHVVIGKGADGTYLVTVSPSLPNHPPMIFNEYRRARGYAGGLRLVHRWAIHDETGGGK